MFEWRVTYEIVGRYEDAGEEQNGGGNPVMAPEDDIVNDGFLDQVADLDEPRHCGHKCQNGHLARLTGLLPVTK